MLTRNGMAGIRVLTPSIGRWHRLWLGWAATMRLHGWLALVWCAALVPYWRTLHPTFHTFDVAEFAAGAYDLGIVHNPGYPAYLLIAHAFQLLPLGDLAYRLNVLSALCASLTVSLLALVLWELTRSRLVASVAALVFGYSYYQWTEAIIATPYTMNSATLALELLLLLRWRRDRQNWRLYAVAILYGLQFGFHASAALQCVGIATLILTEEPRILRRGRMLFGMLALFVLGLSTYLYLPLRYLAKPQLDYARILGLDLINPADLWAMVSGHAFGYAMFGYGPEGLINEATRFVGWLWANFLGTGAVFGALGCGRLVKTNPGVAGGLAALFATHVAFYVGYNVPNKDTMFLPAYLVWTIWVGVALAWLVPLWIDRLRHLPDWRATAERDVRLVLCGLALVPLVVNFPRVDASQDYTARRYAEAVMDQLPPGALVLGTWLDITPLHFMQIVEGARPDVRLYDIGLHGLGRASRLRRDGISDGSIISDVIRSEIVSQIESELARRPVHLLGRSPILEETFRVIPSGRTYQVVCRSPPAEGNTTERCGLS